MFGKQAKTIPFTKKNFDGAFLLHSAFSESAFFESAFFEGAFLESAFLESAFSETYRKIDPSELELFLYIREYHQISDPHGHIGSCFDSK